MPLDPRTPVLVGAAVAGERHDEARHAPEAAVLMGSATELAAADAGAPSLLREIDVVLVPRGFWGYADPGRLVATRVGAGATTVVAEIGVLQTSLVAEAARRIDAGAGVVLVVGGEARHRSQTAARTGVEVVDTEQPGAEPDEVLRPAADILEAIEVERNFAMPAHQYAAMETAWRRAHDLSVDEHRRDLAHLWARYQRVAVENPHAWDRTAHSLEMLAGGPGNRMVAFPYAKLHSSQWNVDQAAALLFCSVEVARRHGVPDDRLVFPVAVAESNFMTPLVRRAEPHACPAFELAGRAALEAAGCNVDDVAHLELYSCFPIAVRVQLDALGVGPDRSPTVTGGMAFAGGPLNNFVLQAIARMTEILRADPGSRGMVTAVSGMLTKQGVSLWSTRPARGGFSHVDVTAAAAAATATVPLSPDGTGSATVAAYTVVHVEGAPFQAVAVCDLADGTRTVATSHDPGLMAAMIEQEWVGRAVQIPDPGALTA